ncbi:MAG TPA: TAXI family TRAP transporter solute-binding subunit [Burkholderiales bacterium]
MEVAAAEHAVETSALQEANAETASDFENVNSSAEAASYAPGLEGTPPDLPGRLQGTPVRSTGPNTWLSLTSYPSYLLRFARPPRLELTKAANGECVHSARPAAGVDELHPVIAAAAEPIASVVMKTRQLKWLAVPLVCAPLLLILWATIVYSPLADRLESRAPTAAAETPRLIATDALHTPIVAHGLPRIGLTIDADNATDAHIAHDLRRVVAPDAGLEVVVQPGAVLFSKNSLPGLAVVRYESLQNLRTIKNPVEGGIDGLRVLMPLYTEEIYFIVRRDSPLTFIHQIHGARINVGSERSSRRWTVERLYGAMFETAVPAANMKFHRDEEAFKNLVSDRTVDVVVVVAAQPAKPLSTLGPHISRSIKLLKLDPQHAASRRAIDVYLPATVRAANYRAWVPEDTDTLATMAFLVSTGNAAADTAGSLEMFAQSLCRKLPLLRRDGHPKWREVQPGLEIDVGWAYSAVAKTALQTCEASNPAGASVVRR